MSHFAVMVITDQQPDQDALSKILAPWHEFECTGIDDEHVQNIDMTDEALAGFAEATVTRMKAPDGSLHNRFTPEGAWKPEFSQPDPDPVFSGNRRIEFIPPGYESVDVPASSVETAAEWIKHHYGWGIVGRDPGEETKFGYIALDSDGNVVQCIDRTNPNKKWDFWELGGRWAGRHLRLKAGASTDQAMVRDLDFVTPREEARAKACDLWEQVHAITSQHPRFDDFATIRDAHPDAIETARDVYWAQPAIAALKTAFRESWDLDKQLEAARMGRDAYAQRCADTALATFAVVKDGKWHERGEMGWFAFVRDEKDALDWSAEFAALLGGLPETAWLSIVDCHI